jgi:hypothetical protein
MTIVDVRARAIEQAGRMAREQYLNDNPHLRDSVEPLMTDDIIRKVRACTSPTHPPLVLQLVDNNK